jgi:hypothetical protein
MKRFSEVSVATRSFADHFSQLGSKAVVPLIDPSTRAFGRIAAAMT